MRNSRHGKRKGKAVHRTVHRQLTTYRKGRKVFTRSPEKSRIVELMRQHIFRFTYELDKETRGLWYPRLERMKRAARKNQRRKSPYLHMAYVAAQMCAYGFDSSTPHDKPKPGSEWGEPYPPILLEPRYDEKRGVLAMPMDLQFHESYREFFQPDHKTFQCPWRETTPFQLIGKVRVMMTIRSPDLYGAVDFRRVALLEFPIDYGMCAFNKLHRMEAFATSLKVWREAKARYEFIELRKLPVARITLRAEHAVDFHPRYELRVSPPSTVQELVIRNPSAKPYQPTWVK